MKINKNSYLFSILFTFVATFVLVLPLTLAYTGTKPIADNYWRLQHYVKTLRSLGLQADASQPQQAEEQYKALKKFKLASFDNGNLKLAPATDTDVNDALQTSSATGNLPTFFYTTDVGGEKRFAGDFTGPGLWGNVTLAVGVNQDASSIEGVQVLYNVETPGLGGRINEKGFQGQFANLKPQNGQVEFNLSGQKNPNGFDAITGATITSTAVRDIINNRALPELKALITQMGGM